MRCGRASSSLDVLVVVAAVAAAAESRAIAESAEAQEKTLLNREWGRGMKI